MPEAHNFYHQEGSSGEEMGSVNLKKTIYKITVVGWEDYNGSLKKGHKCILLSTGFLDNAKVRSQTLSGRLLYLSCLLLAGESKRSQFTVTHESLAFQSGVKSQSLQSQLDQLQSFQLVTYEKIEPLLDRIGKDRKGKEGIGEDLPGRSKKTEKPEAEKLLNKKVWEAYCEAFFHRYHEEPVRNAAVNGKISQIAKRLGEDAPFVVQFFVNHPDSFYVKNMHAIGLCLRDAEALHVQWRKGKAITSADIRNYERNQAHHQLMRDIEKDGV